MHPGGLLNTHRGQGMDQPWAACNVCFHVYDYTDSLAKGKKFMSKHKGKAQLTHDELVVRVEKELQSDSEHPRKNKRKRAAAGHEGSEEGLYIYIYISEHDQVHI